MNHRNPAPGEAFLYLYRLRPGAGPEYDRRHAEVWPEIRALIDAAGIYDYQIWRHEEIVVCRMRARAGYSAAVAVTGLSAVQARWTASLDQVFDTIATTDGEPLWLEEVFSHALLPDDRRIP
ncbi:MAG: L-rhamnose mutarotase [Devosia sp.]|nr:L-rhamnose mutarotase [Devosia sp.]